MYVGKTTCSIIASYLDVMFRKDGARSNPTLRAKSYPAIARDSLEMRFYGNENSVIQLISVGMFI